MRELAPDSGISYQIQPVFPEAHLFQVVMAISSPDPQGQRLTLPAWIPGSYMIRDFTRNIVTIEATCGDERVALEKIDKQTWRCDPCTSELRLVYRVYAWDLSVRSAHLDTTHGYFNGTSVFLRVMGRESNPCQVEILRPDGDAYRNWRLATTLSPLGGGFLGFGRFRAENYEELIDHPVEMGTFSHAAFEVAGVPHDIVISGRYTADMKRLCRDLQAICTGHVEFFGELPAMDRYLFQVMAVGDGYGGLEHRSSTSLICKRNDLPAPGGEDQPVSGGYREFLGLCSHEYFHLWNVKRIRPQVFKTSDLTREVHTDLLWAFEGITSYYDDLELARSGRITPDSYLELLARLITRVHRGSGRLKQSVAESSYDTWTKFYKQDENAANAIVSYYAKGALVALALDFTLRTKTGWQRSLDDLMRMLWQRHGKPDVGVPENGIELLAQEVAGCDLGGFFEQFVHGTADPPLKDYLGQVGIGMAFRPSRGPDDKGGAGCGENSAFAPGPGIGARYRAEQGHLKLMSVSEDGAAQKAGLSAGDLLLAIDGIRVTQAGIQEALNRVPVGTPAIVHAFRRDELMEFSLVMEPAPADTCDLWFLPDPDIEVSQRRAHWLGISRESGN